MMKKKLLVFLVIFFSITLNSFSIEPDIFVQSTVNRASKLLGEDISKNQKIEKLKIIAKETVDIKGIGFYTLGSIRKNLDQLSKLSRDEILNHRKQKFLAIGRQKGFVKELCHLFQG